MNLNKVIIRNVTIQENNVHLAVHPFGGDSRMMSSRGDYREDGFHGDIPQWKKTLADALWDNVPGISLLFFSNGEVTLQHCEVLSDADVVDIAGGIIYTFLRKQLNYAKAVAEDVLEDTQRPYQKQVDYRDPDYD